jgi:hypothetical protein
MLATYICNKIINNQQLDEFAKWAKSGHPICNASQQNKINVLKALLTSLFMYAALRLSEAYELYVLGNRSLLQKIPSCSLDGFKLTTNWLQYPCFQTIR